MLDVLTGARYYDHVHASEFTVELIEENDDGETVAKLDYDEYDGIVTTKMGVLQASESDIDVLDVPGS